MHPFSDEENRNTHHDASRRRSSLIDATPQSDPNIINQTDGTLRKLSAAVPNLSSLTEDAKAAAQNEKSMGFRESFRMYPLGVFFSFGLSLAVANELEIQQSAGTRYQDCFKGTDLRRTEVTVMV